MKQLSLLIFLYTSTFLSSQIVDIPDSSFLNALIELGVDTNDDGYIQYSEASVVDTLNISHQGISELQGIESFQNLIKLTCRYNSLKSLTLIANPKLEYLDCYSNSLQDLNIVDNYNLIHLQCGINKLAELDVSNNNKLTHLHCSYNNLSQLDISQNQKLENLSCLGGTVFDIEIPNYPMNNFTQLDLSNNPELLHLSCSFHDSLTNLDLSNNPKIILLNCSDSNLSNLNVSNNPELIELDCSTNPLTSLDLSNCPRLNILRCQRNKLSELLLTNNLELTNLSCYLNFELKLLDISNCKKLERLDCKWIDIDNLDLTNNPKLNDLDCAGNSLINLDLTSNHELFELNCFANALTILDLTHNPNLTSLNCSSNQLTKLDLSSNHKLEYLRGVNNNFSCLILEGQQVINYLEVTNNPNLSFLKTDETVLTDDSFIALSTTNLKIICAGSTTWQQVSQDIPNVIFNENCVLFACQEQALQLSGKITYSEDNCSIESSISSTISQFEIQIDGISFTFSNNGLTEYNFYIPVDTLTVETLRIKPVFQNPESFISDPPYYELTISENHDSLDFCVTPTNNLKTDNQIKIYTTTSPRPGFEHIYKLDYSNLGNLITSGNLSFRYDTSQMDFIFSDDDWTLNDNELILQLQEFLPLETRNSELTFILHTPMDESPIIGGESLRVNAAITTEELDCNRSDNYAVLNEEVVNSFDPNDKTCLQGEYFLTDTTNQFATYRIRFENTGTASAVNITIRDTINTDVFDVRQVNLISASHPVQMSILGDELIFEFIDIYLPIEDEENDGYVVFEIKVWDDLPLETNLENTANIYFDFNWPIQTNTSNSILVTDEDMDGFHHLEDCDDQNALINPLSIEIPNNGIDEDCDGMDLTTSINDKQSLLFNFYPNPVDKKINITANQNIEALSIYTINGKQMMNIENLSSNKHTLDINNLNFGVYMIKVKFEKGTTIRRFIKQ